MRALGVFWAVVALLLLGGAAVLQAMGPLPRPAPAPVALKPPSAPSWDGAIANPDAALLEQSRGKSGGLLPRIAADGRTPRQVYARPAPPPDGKPRVALVLAGFGQSEADSRAAIALPGAVTLAVSAYGRNPEALLAAARAAGHELLASLPMESERFPLDDAGQYSLLTGAPPAENEANMELVMARIQGYVGMTGASDGLRGERFMAQTSSFDAVLAELTRRGLLYLDPRPPGAGSALAAGTVGRAADILIDTGDPPARAEIEGRLAALERLARERGSAVGLAGRLRPVVLDRIASWARDAEGRGIVLVPISALVTESPHPQ